MIFHSKIKDFFADVGMEMLLGVSFLKQSHEMHILFVVLMFFGHHMDA
jgi:hypothetical protein